IDPEKYRNNLAKHLRELPADQLITTPELAGTLAADIPFTVTASDGSVTSQGTPRFDVPTLPEDTLFLQFSGGTTGLQKCVAVTEAMLDAQRSRLSERLRLTAADRVVSWLPLYHDMGLIACLWLPLLCGVPSTHLSAADWLLNPELLFRHLHNEHGTLC